MEKKELHWSDVPKGWALCYNNECPLHENCLRFWAGDLAKEQLTVGRCVFPQALHDGQCSCFATTEPVRYARGFTTIYDHVVKKDFTSLRKRMTMYLQNKGRYYQYMRGERPLSPEQQAWIRQLFTEYGYANDVVFDGYEERLEFPWV